MKFNDRKILCLTFDELVPDIMPKGTYDSLKARKQITVFGRSAYGREVLIEFETLPLKYRDAITKQYGDPYQYIAKQPLIDYVKINWDDEAERFYSKYVLPNKSKLPETHVEKYTKAATWLNAIQHFTTDKRALKQALNVSIEAFWELVGDLLRSKKVAVPYASKRLKEALKAYKKDGYACLVEAWRFGNSNSAKINDEVSEALLVQLIAHPHKHDDTIIAAKYNEWAVNNNRAAITPAAVGYWRKKTALLTTLTRDGAAVSYNKFSKRIERERPSAPMLLINSDDNILDLYFKETKENKKGKTVVSEFYRPAVYVIIDAFNDYILGYAIGEEVTIELIKAAYRNAMNHVMELTGDSYLWHQIQTDHWAIDKQKTGPLATFFSNQAHFTPAAVKVAQGKYIERSFGITWHQELKMFPNYAGYNITAQEKRNPDAIQLLKKDYPDKESAPQYVAKFIENMRQTVNPASGLPRKEEWLKAFKNSLKSQKRQITAEKRLQLFGITHTHTNRITAAGIIAEIGKKKYNFEIPNELYMEHVNKQVQVTYDPYNMDEVLISDGRGLRFVAKQFQKMPSALADYQPDDRERLNNLLDFKKEINTHIMQQLEERKKTLSRYGVDAASILQAGVTDKAVSHQAQRQIAGQVFENEEPAEVYDWRQAL
ncbi:hypothetical protein [Mucilaginibacter sp. L3T2-6]|uniref:hypothetical protein n=1 Tax=Mucilaginibacter sp. L3T2-6 TaxID=3062491 RepID=UPI00267719F9|nr:hypothetical protein [Mucilaginibacter sp. L3T2-6]MDO3641944.1 hypothetical protein [Mucilaginibacter sp. L3T2-6]MDV6214378.1 hypothetical protein [Mucilaginibacter sp. L3T2-6]